MAATPAPAPSRRNLLLRWLGDLLVSSLIALPFAVPVLIEGYRLAHREVEEVDVWQFDSMPDMHASLRDWGTHLGDRQVFRVDELTKDKLVLRFIRKKEEQAAASDWQGLHYANARLLSSDSLAVQNVDWPRSAPAWASIFAGSLAAFVVLTIRVKRAWLPEKPWRLPAGRAWLLVALVLMGTLAAALLIQWLRDISPLTSLEKVIPQLNGWALWLAFCSAALAGPAVEETLYRGCLFGRFRAHGYAVSGAVVSAVMFALAHGAAALLPNYFIKGLILAWVCHRTESLWAPFTIHACWNIFALAIALRG